MAETIEIIIGKDGKSKVHVKGVKGKECVDLTADLEKSLGDVTECKKTSEFSAPAVNRGNRLKQGGG